MHKLKVIRHRIDKLDLHMEKLFIRRMHMVSEISEIKKEEGIPIFDSNRECKMENEILKRHKNDALGDPCVQFSRSLRAISKQYQKDLIYQQNVIIKSGALDNISEYFDLDRKVFIITDSNIPAEYIRKVSENCKDPFIYVLKAGESIKCISNVEKIIDAMLQKGFCRKDCIVGIGGGTITDLSGFVSSIYMRGITFYSVPTTVLSMADASIGGKTGINYSNTKNTIGSFYDATKILIDPNVLTTLDNRQYSSGLSECVKVGALLSPELFDLIEKGNCKEKIEEIIRLAVNAKLDIVSKDKYEHGNRAVLNFGHTIGHAIESASGLGELLHGECISIGMVPMCQKKVRNQIKKVLVSLNLPIKSSLLPECLAKYIEHDKKSDGKTVNAVILEDIGKYVIKPMTCNEILLRYKEENS